jgi:hypothetical protein
LNEITIPTILAVNYPAAGRLVQSVWLALFLGITASGLHLYYWVDFVIGD